MHACGYSLKEHYQSKLVSLFNSGICTLNWIADSLATAFEKLMENFTTILILLTFAVTLVCCQRNSGRCTAGEVAQYQRRNLDPRCVTSLSLVFGDRASPQNINDPTLRTVCREDCGGNLADWFENYCRDTFSATNLYYACIQTRRAQVGRYCIYSLPPVYDANQEIMAVMQACQGVVEQQRCLDQCVMLLQNFTSQLGCCYQSIYNNLDFIQGAADNGVISRPVFNQLRALGNPMLWSVCGVRPPNQCTIESFGFPWPGRGGSMSVLPHLSIITTLIVMATALTGFA